MTPELEIFLRRPATRFRAVFYTGHLDGCHVPSFDSYFHDEVIEAADFEAVKAILELKHPDLIEADIYPMDYPPFPLRKPPPIGSWPDKYGCRPARAQT